MTGSGAVLAAGALAVTLVLGGCGGGDDSAFGDEVTAIEEAVEAGDRDAALRAFEALRADVGQAREAGEIDEARYAELSVLVEKSRVLLDTVLPAPPTAPPPEPDDKPDDEGDREHKDDKDEDEKDEKDERDKDERDKDEGDG